MNRALFSLIALLLTFTVTSSSYVYAASNKALTLKDNFARTTIDYTKWVVNLGYAGSFVTQDDALFVNDRSMYPTYSSVTSISQFELATISVDFCMRSPASFWAEVQVMLTDSTTNQFGENIQEIFIRKGNVIFADGAWYPIDGTTPDSLCIFYQSRLLGSWGNEVLIAKKVNENTWYHLRLENTQTSLDIEVTHNDIPIGSYISTRGPINTSLHVVLSAKSQSTDYTLTGAFDNLKVQQIKN